MTRHRHTAPGPGESDAFHLETTWWVAAERRRVWDVLSDVSSWQGWWPGIACSRQSGEHAQLVVRSPLGYRLRFTVDLLESDPPDEARFDVADDLRGTGHFTGMPDSGGTRVRIMWCVVTRRRLVGLLRPVARWAHAAVMRAGEQGLRTAVAQRG